MYLPDNTLLHGGQYKIVRHIKSGGFGNTYEGFHTQLKARVAIKEFFPKNFCSRSEDTSVITVTSPSNRNLIDKLRKKFIEEASSIFKMNHPNIVKVHDVFEDNGTAYYVMDYIDGCSLSQIVSDRDRLPEAEAVDYIRQVADALSYVHSQNRLHLDIKPGNVMVDSKGHVTLIDFGASKHYDTESGENTSTLLGINTKGYAPVEQSTVSFTKFSPATDIYALGATLYKLLTGVTPPDANLLLAKEETLLPLPAYISEPTRNAVYAAMELIRADRPQSIDEFLSILPPPTLGDSEITVFDDEDAKKKAEEEAIRKAEEEKRRKAEEEAKRKAEEEAKRKAEEEKRRKAEEEAKRKAEEEAKRKAEEEKRRKAEEERKRKAEDNKKPKRHLWLAIAAITCVFALIIGGAIYSMCSGTSDDDDDTVSTRTKDIEDEVDEITYNSNTNCIVYGDNSYRMVPVVGGTFSMGCAADEADSDEVPVHSVTLSSFFIGQTEVPQWLWSAVMGDNPSSTVGDNLPVESVSWIDTKKFIMKINKLTDLTFRLPTEAEWEFAARGGNSSRDYKYSGSDDIDDVAWYDDNSSEEIHPVAKKQHNELGLYDMTGNVWEWCSDWYSEYPSYDIENPTGVSEGELRIVRGGGFNIEAQRCRSSYRSNGNPEFTGENIGFRLVLEP